MPRMSASGQGHEQVPTSEQQETAASEAHLMASNESNADPFFTSLHRFAQAKLQSRSNIGTAQSPQAHVPHTSTPQPSDLQSLSTQTHAAATTTTGYPIVEPYDASNPRLGFLAPNDPQERRAVISQQPAATRSDHHPGFLDIKFASSEDRGNHALEARTSHALPPNPFQDTRPQYRSEHPQTEFPGIGRGGHEEQPRIPPIPYANFGQHPQYQQHSQHGYRFIMPRPVPLQQPAQPQTSANTKQPSVQGGRQSSTPRALPPQVAPHQIQVGMAQHTRGTVGERLGRIEQILRELRDMVELDEHS